MLRSFAKHLALFVFFAASPALAARDCTQAEKADGDRWAWLSPRDTAGSIGRHLPWGEPVQTTGGSNEHLVVLTDYVNRFDYDLLIPLWSAERVEGSRLGKADRIDCFRPHPRHPAHSDLKNDYDEDTYDQGHMAPADNHDTSVRAMVNTFYYTNMVPQLARFNQVTWRRLEAVVRGWALSQGRLYVITGSVLDRDQDGRRDADSAAVRMQPRVRRPARVAVPTAFFKIIAYPLADGRLATLSIILPHSADRLTGRALGRHFEAQVTTLAEIERVSGFQFFPAGPRIVEERRFCAFAGGAPASLCR